MSSLATPTTSPPLRARALSRRVLTWVAAHAEWAALGVLAVGFALRVVLAALGWPATDSDEGTMGLMALHIAFKGAHPVFFYGQAYMGALEAYLAAALFRLFGPSLFLLRLAVILLSTAALGVIFLLLRRLYSPGLALASLVLLTLGSTEALDREIFAGGGYAETLLFGALALFLAHHLARDAHPAGVPSRRRLAMYVGLGITIGLGIWSDVLVAPFVVGALVLLALFRWREVLGRAGLLLVLGFLIGYAPVLAYAAQAPDHNPLAVAAGIDQSSSAYAGNVAALVFGEVTGTVAVAVPTISGGSALAPLAAKAAWPLAPLNLAKAFATLLHSVWGLGFLALLGAAIMRGWREVRQAGVTPASAWPPATEAGSSVSDAWPPATAVAGYWASGHKVRLRGLGAARRGGRPAPQPTASVAEPDARSERTDNAADAWARAMLVGAAALTVVLFASSPVAARAPATNARYLIGVLVALPALLYPLWSAAWNAASEASRWRWWARAALVLVLCVFVAGAVEAFGGVPYARGVLAQQQEVIAVLERHGVTAVYSEYWTCDRLAFLTREQVICAALSPTLGPDLDRYLPYRAEVARAPHPWYIFPITSAQAQAFAARAAQTPGAYTRYVTAGYVLYQPRDTAALPSTRA